MLCVFSMWSWKIVPYVITIPHRFNSTRDRESLKPSRATSRGQRAERWDCMPKVFVRFTCFCWSNVSTFSLFCTRDCWRRIDYDTWVSVMRFWPRRVPRCPLGKMAKYCHKIIYSSLLSYKYDKWASTSVHNPPWVSCTLMQPHPQLQ